MRRKRKTEKENEENISDKERFLRMGGQKLKALREVFVDLKWKVCRSVYEYYTIIIGYK